MTPRQFFRGRAGLIAANVALLGLLAALAMVSSAGAQNSSARARGEYTLVAGRSNSGGSSVVYVVDTSNQEVVALQWDPSHLRMTGVGYRSLASDRRVSPGR